MSIPSFKVSSKPTISETEFNANKKDGGKFLNDPGTYDLVIKAVEFKETPSEKDTAWLSVTLVLESPEGKTMKHFVMVPTECRNGFLFGAQKQTFALEGLQKFFRGLGLVFDYDNGMEQVAAIFGNPDVLIGKTLKCAVGYKGITIKYVAKEEYQVVEKDYKTLKVEGTFASADAAKAAALDAGIKPSNISGFINVLDIFAAKEPQIFLENSSAGTVDLDLPF